MEKEKKVISVAKAAFELANARGLPETRRSYNKELLMRFLLEDVPVELIDDLAVDDKLEQVGEKEG